MPTVITHAVVGLALGRVFTARPMPRIWYWDMLLVLSMLPDLDVLAFQFGIPYEDFLGHRGFSHSLCFAWLVGGLVALVCYRKCGVRFLDLWGLFFVVTASHGLLDAFTNGGLGVAFFAPFDNERYFFPWTPIQVSLIGRHFFTSSQTWATLTSEVLWVWLPTGLLVAVVECYRFVRKRPDATASIPQPPPADGN